MTSSSKPPRPASTVIVVRDGSQGPEVFLMQRTLAASFMAGVHVFPGGAVDAADHDPDYGVDDKILSGLLELESGGAAYLVAAVRECFEEAGLLLARDARGRSATLPDKPQTDALRRQLSGGSLQLKTLLAERGWAIATEDLAYLSHWVTPVGAPKRFDTRFFVAVAPPDQEGSHDDEETIASLWIRPAEALRRADEGSMKLAHATQSTLRELSRFDSVAAIMQWAGSPRNRPCVVPRVSVNSRGRKVLSPGDFAYAEIGKIDPQGLGTAWSEIRTGVLTQLSPRVWRIAAPNPGFMTGPGTNTYLVGDEKALAVIDPGPDIEEHLTRVAEEGRGRIRLILSTHTHRDHSPGAARLKALTGARVVGMPAPDSEFHDKAFAPDHVPVDGERFTAGGASLRVVHTPGHASNHCCYLLEDEQLLFTGDHIMQGSTVVINPPDGDMAVYLASLAKIRGQGLQWLAPGHGFLMDQPDARIDRLVAHRLAREAKVLAALQKCGPISAEALVPEVYDDVPRERHGMALRSLTAHLKKLHDEQRAVLQDSLWRAA